MYASHPPPYSNGGATDRYGFKIKLYKDIRSILDDLKQLGIPMAAASRYNSNFLSREIYFLLFSCRTEDPAASRELLGVLGIDKCFQQLEIFPSKKFTHFDK